MNNRTTRNSLLSEEVQARFTLTIRGTYMRLPLLDRKRKPIAWISTQWKEIQLLPFLKKGNCLASCFGKRRCSTLLYNSHTIQGERPYLIITLGIPPVWRLWQYGFDDVIGLLFGQINKQQLNFIDSVVHRNGTLWLLSDGTDVAMRICVELRKRLASIRYTQHRYTPYTKLVNSSREQVQKLFSCA